MIFALPPIVNTETWHNSEALSIYLCAEAYIINQNPLASRRQIGLLIEQYISNLFGL